MTATSINKRRINVTFPESLLETMESIIAPRERNNFIVGATERALRQQRLLKAIEKSSGAWADEGYPELGTDEEIDAYVRRLRETWMPASLTEIAEGQADHG
ncbi:MAG: hypothetical protein IAE85_05430 [Anaerolinea sp.]|nr:hypothetical protein [Anaerolinea sp.]